MQNTPPQNFESIDTIFPDTSLDLAPVTEAWRVAALDENEGEMEVTQEIIHNLEAFYFVNEPTLVETAKNYLKRMYSNLAKKMIIKLGRGVNTTDSINLYKNFLSLMDSDTSVDFPTIVQNYTSKYIVLSKLRPAA
ncbi:MAG: hypothetical protein ABIM99_01745 [Candidatus Dojkabacteria bacterium]